MISRRQFIKNSLLGAGALAFSPLARFQSTAGFQPPISMRPWLDWAKLQSDYPDGERLGRNATQGWIELRAKPSPNAASVGKLYEDTVVVWLREVIGDIANISRRWVETPEGYVYAPNVQPCFNQPNEPLSSLPETEMGRGMWAEVTVPYTDLYVEGTACSFWVTEVPHPRLYYSQVMWIDDITTNSQGQVLYRVNEKYGNCGDVFWAAAEAFRPITEEEISPIHPEVEEKRIVVNLNYQTLSCFEGKEEVYFCQVSSGAKFNAAGEEVDAWSTPAGVHTPWRKVISIHMGAGSTGAGYDTPGIPWTILFDPDGAAIHSTFWHNDFGVPRSHGCVNCRPEDAKWIWRWSLPSLGMFPGDQTLTGIGGTLIEVVG